MIDDVTLERICDWDSAFIVLGVDRSRSFLQDMGLPNSMASAPQSLVTIAREFYVQLQSALSLDVVEPTARSVFAQILRGALARLSDAYGEADMKEFYEWAERHFVDHQQKTRWYTWSSILPSLAGAYPYPQRRPRVPSPFSPEKLERFVRTVRARFSDEIDESIEQRIEAAASIPLSEEEREMVAIPSWDPGDPTERDVLLRVQRAWRDQSAFEVWKQLKSWLDPADQEALLHWGRDEGAVMDAPFPSDFITLPDPS